MTTYAFAPEFTWIAVVGGIFCFFTACGIGERITFAAIHLQLENALRESFRNFPSRAFQPPPPPALLG